MQTEFSMPLISQNSQILLDPFFIGCSLGIVGVLILGAAVILRLKRWREDSNRPQQTNDAAQEQYNRLAETGDLSPEELEKVMKILKSAQHDDNDPDSPVNSK